MKPKAKKLQWFSTFMLTLATLMLTYPFMNQWFSAVNQSLILEQTSSTADLNKQVLDQIIQSARDYNNSFATGKRTLNESDIYQAAPGDKDYLAQLNGPEGVMGRIKIESINVDLPIYHGTSDEILKHGAGHLFGSSLPVGGNSTHSIITAHRGLATATLFTNLDKVQKNDKFSIETFDEVIAYKVVDIRTIEPGDTEQLRIKKDRDLVTLVTCTPLGINTHRILVTGERIHPTPKNILENANKKANPGLPYWILIPTIGFSITIYLHRKSSISHVTCDGKHCAICNG